VTAAREISVLLVDDDESVRAGLALLIETEPGVRIVGVADDGVEAVALARQLCPDVVVMDLRMPRLNGVEATRRLVADDFVAETGYTVPVLILTIFDDDENVHAALRAGASGYLLKSVAPRQLGDAIRAVAAGDGWLHPSVTRSVIAEIATRPDPSLPTPGDLTLLTARENEVLVLVAHGLSNAEIAGYLMVTEATVKTHLGRVITKLNLRDRAQAVATAYRTGLVSPHDSPPEPTPRRPTRRLT
jgi:DNA-binding NarL/FixJ family response regulator